MMKRKSLAEEGKIKMKFLKIFLFVLITIATPFSYLFAQIVSLPPESVNISATVPLGAGNSGGGGGSGYYCPGCVAEIVQATSTITFTGTAYSYAHLVVLKDGQNFLNTVAVNGGNFSVTSLTINPGVYTFSVFLETQNGTRYLLGTWVIEIKNGIAVTISGITIPQSILDILFPNQVPIIPIIPTIKNCSTIFADINCDDKVDISDISILAYWYRLKQYNKKADLNNDKVIDLGDFSVLAYYWTG